VCIYLPIHWHQLPIIKLREKVEESNAELVIAQIIDDVSFGDCFLRNGGLDHTSETETFVR